MDENINSNEEMFETNEVRSPESRELDDATNEPLSFIEQNGNYEQSEAIQNTIELLVEQETIDTSQLDYDPGPVKQPPDWDHGPPHDRVNLEDEETVMGRQPGLREDLSGLEATPINTPSPVAQLDDNSLPGQETAIRDDLDQVTENEDGGTRDEATPINLPGPEMLSQVPDPGPDPFPNIASEDDWEGPAANQIAEEPDHGPNPFSNVTAEDDWEAPVANQIAEEPDHGPNPFSNVTAEDVREALGTNWLGENQDPGENPPGLN